MKKSAWMLVTALAAVAACTGEAGREAAEVADRASEVAHDAADEASEAAQAAGDAVREAAHDAGEALEEAAHGHQPLLDPNAASAASLGAAGISDEAVAAIVAGRPYEDMVAVDAALASVLDEAGREEAYGAMWIPFDLNTASREEILLVPGVGDRMAHEFEEYRPYQAMAEFRREIGKYVDDEEVERLARYVTVGSE